MNDTKRLKTILTLQVAFFLVVPILFKLLVRQDAALFAGGLFVLMGLIVISLLKSWKHTPFKILFWITVAYLLVVIPGYTGQMIYRDLPFDSFYMFGIPGTIYHRLSQTGYVAMTVTAAVELFRIKRKTFSATK